MSSPYHTSKDVQLCRNGFSEHNQHITPFGRLALGDDNFHDVIFGRRQVSETLNLPLGTTFARPPPFP